jgi:hypothetical protein
LITANTKASTDDPAQEDQIHKGPRTSRRQKKTPKTKDDNFLWQMTVMTPSCRWELLY